MTGAAIVVGPLTERSKRSHACVAVSMKVGAYMGGGVGALFSLTELIWTTSAVISRRHISRLV